MLNKKPVKGLIGICTAAALCATLGVQAQTTGTQSGSQGGSGQTGSGQRGTGQSGTGQSGTAQGGGGTASGHSGTQGSTASGTGGSGTGTIGSADRKLVTDLAMANMAEIEVARTAQGKSQDDQVKKYAQQMIDDHTKALNEVQQLAQTKGITLPATLDRAHKAKADKLAALSGDAFDRAYMAQAGVAEHKKTHGMLTRAQARAKDADVKALVTRLTPTVEQHLNAAQELRGNKNTAKGNSSTGTEKSGQ
ncbi:putative exported protein [Janthinobacterium sp. CG23_2]|nr:putative exported protein [Janthinobacterium sp. CG23_2]CUU30840.1 putative exported protein [Janthinobacterium sp. CG23_2]